MFDFIPTIKVINKENKDSTNLLKCLNALRVTLNGTLKLWSQLQKESVKFLLTRGLNQDPLENFFGSIRQQGGNADNPTPIQFCWAFRKLFYNHFLEQSSGNCAEDVDKILVQLHLPPRNNSSKENQPLAQDQPFVVDESDYRDFAIDPDQSNSGANAITYVTGYMITKCFQKHKCDTCVSNLVNDELDNGNKLFCYFKGYDSRKTFGGLTVPTDKFTQYITAVEEKIVQLSPTVIKKKGVAQDLLSQLPLFTVPCPDFPGEFVLRLFLRMRIYYILKFGNRELSSPKIKNRKYFKVQNL
ncbi:Hypothetical predicted protein [Paramuricea clavata]|uniref:Transposable element P transposase-like RNase H C-terminal domain-containing protein n=1 Tax=Paramuricea clavata TaxID=317549 RepID=A0A7D9LG53_PARCT|nr:Hypothetical predicted protein [Paramuricea clavata]